jgi:hypothetical protein
MKEHMENLAKKTEEYKSEGEQRTCQLEITCLQDSAVQARISAMPNTALKLRYQ